MLQGSVCRVQGPAARYRESISGFVRVSFRPLTGCLSCTDGSRKGFGCFLCNVLLSSAAKFERFATDLRKTLQSLRKDCTSVCVLGTCISGIVVFVLHEISDLPVRITWPRWFIVSSEKQKF